MSRVSDAASCVPEEVKSVVLSQRRLSERGVHVKEEQCQDPAPEKPRRSLKPAHGECRRPAWAARADPAGGRRLGVPGDSAHGRPPGASCSELGVAPHPPGQSL